MPAAATEASLARPVMEVMRLRIRVLLRWTAEEAPTVPAPAGGHKYG
jgi:hypothetical protein